MPRQRGLALTANGGGPSMAGAKAQEPWRMLVRASTRRCPVLSVLGTGAFQLLPIPSCTCKPHTTKAHHPTPNTRTWQATSFLQIAAFIFCLTLRLKAPAGVGFVHAPLNPRGVVPVLTQPPFVFRPEIYQPRRKDGRSAPPS